MSASAKTAKRWTAFEDDFDFVVIENSSLAGKIAIVRNEEVELECERRYPGITCYLREEAFLLLSLNDHRALMAHKMKQVFPGHLNRSECTHCHGATICGCLACFCRSPYSSSVPPGTSVCWVCEGSGRLTTSNESLP
jgi:hypothetical protein